MNYDYQQGQGGQQDQWGNQGNQQQDPNQQGGYGQQDPNQQGGYGQQQGQGQDQFGGAKQQAKQQIDQAIDQFANKIPGGQQYSQQAKDAAAGALDNLEGEAEKRLGGLGGMFGGDNQGN